MNSFYKITLTFLFLNSFVGVFSQNILFKSKEQKQLYQLKIDTSNYEISILKEILYQDKKRKTNKTWAILFDSFAGFAFVSGIIMMSNSNYENPTANIIGGINIAGGIIYGSVSVPLWKAAHKRKKQRDVLIRRLKDK